MKQNRGEITISTFVIAMLVAVLVISLGSIAMSDLSTEYNVTSGTELDNFKNDTKEITDVVDDIEQQTRNDDLSVVGFFTRGTYAAGKAALNSYTTYSRISNEFARISYVFALVNVILGSIILVILFFVVISAAFRYRM